MQTFELGCSCAVTEPLLHGSTSRRCGNRPRSQRLGRTQLPAEVAPNQADTCAAHARGGFDGHIEAAQNVEYRGCRSPPA